jgi:hypothetical protein
MHLRCLLLFLITTLAGCYALPLDPNYVGPVPRPAELSDYYSVGESYKSHSVEIVYQEARFTLKRITIDTAVGKTTIDFYDRPEKSDSLILVFPVLGGRKNVIENYFAEYFARYGFDAAIVHRSEDFKKPENIDRLEELFRANVIRDRVAIDLFEREYGKKQFGSFGISRGAINVAMTAGVEPRLSHNVMLLGGSDLVSVFKRSDQSRIRKYIESVTATKGITAEQFFEQLRAQLRTEPGHVVQYMDARKTLLFLGMFDRTVPFRYGLKLRRQLGLPQTVFLPAGHYTSILYTQFAKLVPPSDEYAVFPIDYIELEALNFYRRAFDPTYRNSLRLILLRALRVPFDIVGGIVNSLRGISHREELPKGPTKAKSEAPETSSEGPG